MNTIHEEDEEEGSPRKIDLKNEETEVLQQYIKEQRKIYEKAKNSPMKKLKPPKWMCTENDCKWSGKDIEAMREHQKKQHPNGNGCRFKVEYNRYDHPQTDRNCRLKFIKREVRHKKTVEQLEQQIKDL